MYEALREHEQSNYSSFPKVELTWISTHISWEFLYSKHEIFFWVLEDSIYFIFINIIIYIYIKAWKFLERTDSSDNLPGYTPKLR
jgi:hypothetical protein